jgi:hypothetical protein
MDAFITLVPRNSAIRPKHKFCILYVSKVSEIIRDTHNLHFGSNGLEWMLHNFATVKYCIRARNTSFTPFMCRRLAKCTETLTNIILGPMDYNGCFTTLVPQNSAFRLEQKFCILFMPKVSEIISNTHKHHFGSNGLEWMLHNFGTRNSAFGPETRVLHLLRAEG